MKHILMIATGGTIASRETADGLTPQLTSGELLAEVPELEQLCRIDTVQLMNRDSPALGVYACSEHTCRTEQNTDIAVIHSLNDSLS